jgi:hypothetical protein
MKDDDDDVCTQHLCPASPDRRTIRFVTRDGEVGLELFGGLEEVWPSEESSVSPVGNFGSELGVDLLLQFRSDFCHPYRFQS